jgi:NADP-dependent 3-hydroxy acid dehydrogenase YdfG
MAADFSLHLVETRDETVLITGATSGIGLAGATSLKVKFN